MRRTGLRPTAQVATSIDSAKSADLGGDPATGTLIIDFNFAFQPSCAFDPRWACPLAPPENRFEIADPRGGTFGPLKSVTDRTKVPMTDGTHGGPTGAPRRSKIDRVRFLATPRRTPVERLLWSRDIRFVRRLSIQVSGSRLLELDTGMVLIGPADQLTDTVAGRVAEQVNMPEYGLVAVDPSFPESERYLVAMSAAVQLSGLADRIGMAQSTQVVQTKMLDYFFSLRTAPLVRLPADRHARDR